MADYRWHGLSLRPHPIAFLRDELGTMGISPCVSLQSARDGSRVTVAGLVMVRQRPGSAKGVMFITLENEGAWPISSSAPPFLTSNAASFSARR